MQRFNLYIFSCFLTLLVISCQSEPEESTVETQDSKPVVELTVPDFNADSAYAYIERQLSFGPRVPGTSEHEACGDWLSATLSKYADQVEEQDGEVVTFDGKRLRARNIIASFQPEKKHRVLLAAHWDTRPFADYEDEREAQMKPILGANDGASGVGVLLEFARLMKDQPTAVGIDIILFDVEDYGQPFFSKRPDTDDTYCLGSQYWARNLHDPQYNARYGILLDMVGAKDSRFPIEQYSYQSAQDVVEKVWNTARDLGYGKMFPNEVGNPVIDDHYYVNKILGLPMIDIIHRDRNSYTGFGEYWHTHDDDMDVIDPSTLDAVGKTVLKVIYSER